MKERLVSALALLEGVLAANAIQLGTQAETQFKMAMQEIQGAIDTPAPAPEKIIQTEIGTDTVAELVSAKINDVLTGVTLRLGSLENATVSLLDPIKAANDKLDGFEDVLAVIADNTTPEPAEETTAG